MSWTHYVLLGSFFALTSVGLGAFGAHGLRDRVSPSDLLVFETAARYQMYHALALLGVGLLATRVEGVALLVAGLCFSVGILLFSGSLYGVVLLGMRSLGMVTPVGGVLFMVGWVALMVGVLRLPQI